MNNLLFCKYKYWLVKITVGSNRLFEVERKAIFPDMNTFKI